VRLEHTLSRAQLLQIKHGWLLHAVPSLHALARGRLADVVSVEPRGVASRLSRSDHSPMSVRMMRRKQRHPTWQTHADRVTPVLRQLQQR
jgi:hypothetical protein